MSIEQLRSLRNWAVYRKYSMPSGFRKANYTRLSKIYNGIGAAWMPEWARRFLTIYLLTLAPASLIHDYEYVYGKTGYWAFCVANMRLAYNAAVDHHFLLGLLAALLCQVFGYGAFREGKTLR